MSTGFSILLLTLKIELLLTVVYVTLKVCNSSPDVKLAKEKGRRGSSTVQECLK